MEIRIQKDDTEKIITDSEIKSMEECMRVISTSARGSIPYMREMGLERYLPKDNSFQSKSEWLNDLEEQLETWDGRYDVGDARFLDDERVVVEVRANGD